MASTQTMDEPTTGHEGGSGGPPRSGGGGGSGGGGAGGGGGLFTAYKPEQGKWTRLGTIVALGGLVLWGGIFVHERLSGFDASTLPGLILTKGVPLLLAVLAFGACWWMVYGNRKTGDFMIATEGEMKKVSWSNRREVIGSTRVVIIFTLLMALMLFVFDVVFQQAFSWLGVLKAGR